jgi:hypothetical protein
MPAELHHRGVHPGQLQVASLIEGPPHRRGRGDRSDHRGQMCQRLEVADRLTAIDQHQRQVDQDLTTVVDRIEAPPAHPGRQPAGQAQLLREQPQRQHPRVRDQPLVIPDEFQPARP